MDSNENSDKLIIKQEILENNNSINSEINIKPEEIYIKDEYETSNKDSVITKSILRKCINSSITDKRYSCSEKPYRCSVCGHTSALKSDLTRHMRTHTGEKPYSCSICEYKAAQKYLLTRHMTSHTGEKPYSCSVCGHKAALKNDLVRHVRTHTGEKPYSCSVCGHKATQKHNLVRHMRIHAGEKHTAVSHTGEKTDHGYLLQFIIAK